MKFMITIGCVLILSVSSMNGKVCAETSARVTSGEVCPMNLSKLEEKMEVVLGSIINETFKKTMQKSLQASIPEAIRRADGINAQIAYLQKQIREQDRSQSYAENVARKAANNMNEVLLACQPGEEGSYCDAVEQYYIGKASNIANHGFLHALDCYKKQGIQ